jgi:N-acetylmuramoyl-L-alanine amidase
MILRANGELETDATDPAWLEIRHVATVRTVNLILSPPAGIVWHADEDPWSPSRAERLARKFERRPAKGEHAGSYNLVVDRPGIVWACGSTWVGSWHAGGSIVQGLPANACTLGICVANPGRLKKGTDGKWRCWPYKDSIGDCRQVDVTDLDLVARAGAHWLPYTAEQLEACRLITRACAAAWGSCLSWTHGELNPENREDPGPLFPLDEMRGLSLPAERPDAC